MKLLLKRIVQSCFLLYAFPAAVLCGFGRIAVLFEFFAQSFALLPGFIGSFARAAFYRFTLKDCSIDIVIGLGTYFSRANAAIGPNVSIGSYCIIGSASIGARTQIASHVEIPGGRAQHSRDADGKLSNTTESSLTIGEDCWIGASSVIMANLGPQCTIGAGSVVTKEIPACSVAVGTPARVIKNSF